MKSQAQLDSFIAYCKANPELRFWQALRNWVGWPFVLVSDHPQWHDSGVRDTFDWQGRNGPSRADL